MADISCRKDGGQARLEPVGGAILGPLGPAGTTWDDRSGGDARHGEEDRQMQAAAFDQAAGGEQDRLGGNRQPDLLGQHRAEDHRVAVLDVHSAEKSIL